MKAGLMTLSLFLLLNIASETEPGRTRRR